jgi:hypothetical protein
MALIGTRMPTGAKLDGCHFSECDDAGWHNALLPARQKLFAGSG